MAADPNRQYPAVLDPVIYASLDVNNIQDVSVYEKKDEEYQKGVLLQGNILTTAARFLNADAFASTGQGLLCNNMFAYCGNNPVNRVDVGGRAYATAGNNTKQQYKNVVSALGVLRLFIEGLNVLSPN